jgi:hypothetical protein
MVYKLYGLTYEEVKIIEPEFTMSEAGYEAFELRYRKSGGAVRRKLLTTQEFGFIFL